MEEEQYNFDDINELKIYKKINKELCGEIAEIEPNKAIVKFTPSEKMIIDDSMIIHYGFVFSSASFCAMAAVNKPNSMIIYSEVKFLSPIELGNEVTFKANSLQSDLKKREVLVEGFLYNIKIFDAIFHIVVFEKSMFKIDFKSIT
ncbi:PaaI family thioesterase [Helicobacter sp. MIT 14-3879]|uniref:PaaI family thioesterase n=1 Tax=Helicobacter sp. MIT 14-3879 TaxID=2040649 RepID=UPI000E1FB16C|nr:PaaI family thioesterase [Helicobacter sp. MIT 14-3879]RDU64095.1 thioesterase [Helicobacter sp. MIT 14-3879]